MLSLLAQILCWIKQFGALVLNALIHFTNLLVEHIGLVIKLSVQLLPDLPEASPPPPGGVISMLNYVLPLGGLVAGLAVVLALWVAALVFRVPLRWLKVL